MTAKKFLYGCDPKEKGCKCERIHTNGHKNGMPFREDKLVCKKRVK